MMIAIPRRMVAPCLPRIDAPPGVVDWEAVRVMSNDQRLIGAVAFVRPFPIALVSVMRPTQALEVVGISLQSMVATWPDDMINLFRNRHTA
jgi:hypothetical protein